jgi:hypothetical protein
MDDHVKKALDRIKKDLSGFVDTTVNEETLLVISTAMIEGMVRLMGYDLQYKRKDDGVLIPANNVTAFCVMAVNLKLKPPPFDVGDIWENDAGTFTYDAETGKVVALMKRPIETIDIIFKVSGGKDGSVGEGGPDRPAEAD